MTTPTDFQAFPKIERLFRDTVITEKIDGTNAQIIIVPAVDLSFVEDAPAVYVGDCLEPGAVTIFAGSRERWVTPGKQSDNHGFAQWVFENIEELKKLGTGRHFGEWWGTGIQRRYEQTEKHFSLFNTGRWAPTSTAAADGVWNIVSGGLGPSCVRVVPVLYRGPFATSAVRRVLDDLEQKGSSAAPDFMDPEGVITYHEASKTSFKTTLKDDGIPKGLSR